MGCKSIVGRPELNNICWNPGLQDLSKSFLNTMFTKKQLDMWQLPFDQATGVAP